MKQAEKVKKEIEDKFHEIWMNRNDNIVHGEIGYNLAFYYFKKAYDKEKDIIKIIRKYRDGFKTPKNINWRRIDTLNMLIVHIKNNKTKHGGKK